jgi:hypothetical protein
MNRARAVLLIALALAPSFAWAQGEPLGPEFHVNTYTTANQSFASAASDSAGNFVVVWQSYAQDGSGMGIFGQRYESSGGPLGPEFRVNTYTTDDQTRPSVASDASGNFVVVWNSRVQVAGSYGIFGQRYASSGAPLGPEFLVNTNPPTYEFPAVAADASGNFVVVWNGLQDGSASGVFGQRYAATGAPLGSEFRVNTYTTGYQRNATVASDAAGDFVVVWESYPQDDKTSVFGQRFASSGSPIGPEFRANTYTTGDQRFPVVAADSAGDFVVAWSATYQDGDGLGIFGQRYAGTGARLGSEFQINTYTTANQLKPAVACDASGNFVVVWNGCQDQDGSGCGVFSQRYSSAGSPAGVEFRVNTFTNYDQLSTSGAAGYSGTFVVVWMSYTQEGPDSGIYGQRYAQIVGNTLSFVLAASSAGESAGSAAIDVTITTPDGQPSLGASTVDFATADGTATAGADYGSTSGTLSFPAGTPNGTVRTINVPILDDALDEADETFTVALTNPVGGDLGTIATHTVTIVDDDPSPSVSIGDSAVREGPNGTTTLTSLPVELSGPSGLAVSVDFASNDGTATANTDYQPLSGTLVFAPGDTSAFLTVSVFGDDLREGDETYSIDLMNSVNATIADGQGTGTILDDDSWPELSHGQIVRADLQAQPGPTADTDMYSVSQKPYSSYEAVVDETSGSLGPLGPTLERVASDGVTVLQSSSGTGASQSLRWENPLGSTVNNQHIRVRGPGCGVGCDATAVYRIRLYDTTASLARFNNSGTQTTLLLLQNLSDAPIAGDIRFWSPTGGLLSSQSLGLASHAVQVLNTSTVPRLGGQSGTITIGHDGSYGALAGKAVAVEPATGFTFDTPLESKPR